MSGNEINISGFEYFLYGSIITVIASAAAVIASIIHSKKTRKTSIHRLNEITRKYIIRSSLMSLKAMFAGGDSRAPPIKEKLDYWKCQLDGYCEEYVDDDSTKYVNDLRKLIRNADRFPIFDFTANGEPIKESERNELLKEIIAPDKKYQEIVKAIDEVLGLGSFQHGLGKNYPCN